MLYLWASRLLLIAGSLLIAAGTAYGGTVSYMVWRESVSPSTQQMLVLKDGRLISLQQPTQQPDPSRGMAGRPSSPATPSTPAQPYSRSYPANRTESSQTWPEKQSGADQTTSPGYHAFNSLPPLRLRIDAIGIDWPVVLSNSKHMPRFKGVGWLLGSAYPGNPGNLVLYGHLDGPYSTLSRLNELRPEDEFSILTVEQELIYRVDKAYETTSDDVGILAPTSDATATLITCSGRWDSIRQDYSHRLIVTGVLISKH